jgi:hypothetical protein
VQSIVSGFILSVVSLLFMVLFSLPVAALEVTRHPLAPPDTSSPRSTFLPFLNNMNQVYNDQLQTGHLSKEGAAALSRAMRCLDLGEVARSSVREIGEDRAFLLKEILDRIEIPPIDEIPGIEAVKNESLKRWTIPFTEIVTKRITEGEHEGEFLFGADTVKRAKSFYESVKHLPYKPGASVGAYEDFISLPGPLIPGSLINILGGLSLLSDRPFKGGDYIVLESGERGEVVDIGLRSTHIITRDDVQISIPNHILTNSKIINESAPKSRFRVHIEVGVAYGTDVDYVEKILMELAMTNPLVADAPEPRVRFRRMGDSSLDFDLLCWAHRPHDKGKLIHQLNRDIYTTFKQVGIEIPFPQRDVHLIQTTEK